MMMPGLNALICTSLLLPAIPVMYVYNYMIRWVRVRVTAAVMMMVMLQRGLSPGDHRCGGPRQQLLLLTQHFPRHIVRCYTMTRAPCHVSCDVTRGRYSDQRTLLPHHHGGERGARPARVAQGLEQGHRHGNKYFSGHIHIYLIHVFFIFPGDSHH